MDQLYRDLTSVCEPEAPESVHLSQFPLADSSLVDSDLQEKMRKAQIISSLTLSLRKKESIKVRQPLQRIMIPVLDDNERRQIEAVSDLIKSEVNVKEVELIDDASGILVKEIKPNFKVLGPKYGKDMGKIAGKIKQLDQEDISKLEKEGQLEIQVQNDTILLLLNEVEITSSDIEGWLVASQSGLTVALDVTLNAALINEGIARELVNRIQNMRKDAGLEVTDRIDIRLLSQSEVSNAVDANRKYITDETLADDLQIVENLANGIKVEFDNIATAIEISKK
jgi:isoleucyl-tRNA synthetase